MSGDRFSPSLPESDDPTESVIGRRADTEAEWVALAESLRTARDSVRSLEEKLLQEQDRLSGILRSRSWRVTQPLRWLAERTRGLLGVDADEAGLVDSPPAQPHSWRVDRSVETSPARIRVDEARDPHSSFAPTGASISVPEGPVFAGSGLETTGASEPDPYEQEATDPTPDPLALFLSKPSAKLVFPRFDEPLVSMIIPSFNRAEFLYHCLHSILLHTDEVAFEVVVVDDASRDATGRLLERVENVKVVHNERNLDFLRAVNRGAGSATGQYLLLLNNDITVAPNWLPTLVSTIEQYPGCGAVGAKLVRPDGTLQEAGSVIWQDGSASGYGRDCDPMRPEFSYLREVDFCSAACLLVRADLYRRLGGLDQRYLPAYYEDADFCFGIRDLGYKVVLQPEVAVSHHEFGSRPLERAQAQTLKNQPKFVRKWAAVLPQQAVQGNVLQARDRRAGKRLLVIDDQIPAPYIGSGLPRAKRILEFLVELGYVTTLVPSADTTSHQPTTRELQRAGVEVFHGDDCSPAEVLQSRAGYYDVIIISRPHNAERFLRLARECSPDARIIYDAEALFCVREFLRAEVEGKGLSESTKARMLDDELEITQGADVVITVSNSERERILGCESHHNVSVWGHSLDLHVPTTVFSERKEILFVGGFAAGSPPNTDATVHFVTCLLPKIRQQLPGCRFVIAGSQPGEEVRKLASREVIVTGYVEVLTEYYERSRVFAVPLRFGAGISLKLLEAMSHGIPAVISTIAAVGLDLRDGHEALIAETDEEFVEKVVRLYTDEVLWSAVQLASQDYIRRSYSPGAMRAKLAEILGT